MGRGTSIAGRKVSHPSDLYETPSRATEALLGAEYFHGPVLEPCAGYGAISRVLEARGYLVRSSDLLPDGYGLGGVDLYTLEGPLPNVVTNPPYNQAQQVIEHLLPLVTRKACFLLKLTFLESERRRGFFETWPPSRVLVFRRRITMHPHGTQAPVNSGTIAYAWFVWDKDSKTRLELGWL